MPEKEKKSQKMNLLAAKKADVLGEKISSRRWLVMALVAVAVIGTGIWMFLPVENQAGTATFQDVVQVRQAEDVALTVPLTEFEDGRARYYSLTAPGGINVKFFVVKSSDGVIRAAYDACDVCWPAGLGYEQQGDMMVCRNCGRRFPTTSVNVVQGGCNPAPLNRTVKNGQLIIKRQDVSEGVRFFDFKS